MHSPGLVRVMVLLFMLFYPSVSMARYGLSGLAQVGFMDEGTTYSNGSKTSVDSLYQTYSLTYRNCLRNPAFLVYTLGLAYFRENDWMSGGAATKITSFDYTFQFDFFQDSEHPFSIYKTTIEQPSLTVQPGFTYNSKLTEDTYGLNGVAQIRGATLRYTATDNNVDTHGQGGSIDQKTAGGELRYHLVDLTYNYQYITNMSSNQIESIHTAGLSTQPIKMDGGVYTLSFNSQFNSDSYTRSKYVMSSASFGWVPSKRFSSYAALYDDYMQGPGQNGNSVILSDNSTYIISKLFSTFNGVRLSQSTGGYGNSTQESLSQGLSFRKNLDGYLISASTTVDGSAQQEQGENVNSIVYTANGTISRPLPKINGNAFVSSSYSAYDNSRQARDRRYNMGGTFSTSFIKNLTYQSTINYEYEMNQAGAFANTTVVGPVNTNRLMFDNSLVYTMPVNLRGTVIARTGVTEEVGTTPRTYEYAALDFNYVFSRQFNFGALGNYSYDSYNATGLATGAVFAAYQWRQMTFSARADYNYTNSYSQVAQNSRLFIQVSRRF